MAALADPEDVAEAEAGEDLVVVAPGAKISRIFAQFKNILKIVSCKLLPLNKVVQPLCHFSQSVHVHCSGSS